MIKKYLKSYGETLLLGGAQNHHFFFNRRHVGQQTHFFIFDLKMIIRLLKEHHSEKKLISDHNWKKCKHFKLVEKMDFQFWLFFGSTAFIFIAPVPKIY